MGIKFAEFLDDVSFRQDFNTAITTIFVGKGTQSAYASIYAAYSLRILRSKYRQVNTTYTDLTQVNKTSCISYISETLRATITPDYIVNANFKFKRTETITKTGTESDAGSFDNDPTTNDEFRSYPFDTTASDVQSKTRSIVNGAESGESSNVKTYDTEDMHEIIDADYETLSKYEELVNDFLEKYLQRAVNLFRVDKTLCNPLNDESTLLELEY